jgi:antitoxin component YwqK of YwqJK toxin-antitoxin module
MRTVIIFIAALVMYSCNSNTPPEEEKSTTEASAKKSKPENYVEYHPNGVVKLKGLKIDGKRSGKWESYYATGYRWSEVDYRNGVRSGEVISYHPNGMMQYQGRYYNDKRTGVWSFYDTTGILIKKINMDLNPQESDSLLNAK